MRWLDGTVIKSMDMNLNKLRERVKDMGVVKSGHD